MEVQLLKRVGFGCLAMVQRRKGKMHSRNFVFLLLLICTAGLCRHAAGETNSQDVATLNVLKGAWSQTPLPWTGDPCGSHWLGVECDSNNRVVSLILSSMQITGTIPTEIGDLASLQKLDLSFNNLTGSIPKQLGNLRSLNALILQSCGLTGPIPAELGNLSNLTFLALNTNFLTGQIPHSIGLMTQLFWLDLSYNQLSGSLPVSTDGNSLAVGLDSLTMARHFHLNNNSLSGSIPPDILHSNMALIHLLVNSNELSGSIPDEIGELEHIDILNLDYNRLSGTIPTTITQLVTVSELHLDNNRFTGPLPDLSNLSNLQVLDLGNNGFDSSPVPNWFSSLEGLRSLDMQNANLTGELPPEIFGLPQLQEVNFDNNFITGNLTFLAVGQQLELVSLQYNEIDTASFRAYNKTLLLQGNPGCVDMNLPASVCTSPVLSGWNPPNITCKTCPPGLVPNPSHCYCAYPYRGYFLFRAPKFTIFTDSEAQGIVGALNSSLNLSSSQIQLTSAIINSIGALTVDISFFPNNVVQWSRLDVQRISYLLSNAIDGPKFPNEFGPPLFVSFPYDFTVSRAALGLSTGAKVGIILGVIAAVVAMVAVCIYAALQKRRADKAVEQTQPFASWGASGRENGAAPKLKGARWFSFAELKKVSDNFSERNEIGMGGYGKVYKGTLPTGEQVAIKRATKGSLQGLTEFKNEIELLSRVHHKNLVSLVGFCFEQGEQMLVYEYMPNGTLRDRLLGDDDVKMDWHQRLMIGLGSARGIAYLHELANPPIIHRDIKSSNILLDEKNVAKVADFGLSKVGPDEGTGKCHISTQVKGTLGYLDPEYYMTQQLTEKSDVYSFGVVLLELITARPPISRGKYIVREVRTALDKHGLTAIYPLLDRHLKSYPSAEFQTFLELALACVEETAAHRPTMNEVVKGLESLIGHVYLDSGSVDVRKDANDPYDADSELLNKMGKDPSFDYSGGYVVPATIEPK